MLAILDGGTYYHTEAIHGARYRARFDRVLYAPELGAGALAGIAMLIVPDRLHPSLLRYHRPLFLDFLARGGTLAVFGETQAHTWAPGVEWNFRPTNYWWWLEQGATPMQRVVRPEHEIFRHMRASDITWHFHGVLDPPAGAEKVIVVETGSDDDGGTILYDDRITTAGRLIVTTLDPFYHHGSHFMPATTRFLDGFLRWAADTAGGGTPQAAATAIVTKRRLDPSATTAQASQDPQRPNPSPRPSPRHPCPDSGTATIPSTPVRRRHA